MTLARTTAHPAPRSPFSFVGRAGRGARELMRHLRRVNCYFAVRRRSELRTTNTDEHAMAALASMGESRPAIASGTINTL